jgi:thiamine-monophosphate kinase
MRVNLSDLAAKGSAAARISCSRSRCPRRSARDGWHRSFAGSARTRTAYDCSLLGGDTVRTPGPVTISVAALGAVRTAGWRVAAVLGRATASW